MACGSPVKFTRRSITLAHPVPERPNSETPEATEDCNVLVINASREMAKEITIELTLQIPGCSISYAPTIELARLILRRRPIQLIVASPLLPDGSVTKLKETLELLAQPPDVVVVGSVNVRHAEIFGEGRYEFATVKRLSEGVPSKGAGASPAPLRPIILRRQPVVTRKERSAVATLAPSIRDLGADIRNDLNNPLQEIVAMVFVARASHESGDAAPMTVQALEAIERSAKAMSSIVNRLEDKIRDAVGTR